LAAFFTPAETAAVEALAERIFPAAPGSPGAIELGVAGYIDAQLAGPWGQGAQMYRKGPFVQAQDAGHGWQSPLTPAEVYRSCLRSLDDAARRLHGAPCADLGADHLDAVLTALAGGELEDFREVGGPAFFGMLRQNVIEGLFADPVHGGNRDMGGWRWIGYPGVASAHGADYQREVARHGVPYAPEPSSLR
jgi:gluconate 2-dehydrogenase gamma chain